MRTVRFVRDTDPQREGGPGFKKGQVHQLTSGSARHWVVRGAAEYVSDKEAAKAAKPGNQAEPPAESGDADVQGSANAESSDGATVDGAGDVAGQDGGGAGERAEPAGKPAGGPRSARSKPAASGGGKQQRGSKPKG